MPSIINYTLVATIGFLASACSMSERRTLQTLTQAHGNHATIPVELPHRSSGWYLAIERSTTTGRAPAGNIRIRLRNLESRKLYTVLSGNGQYVAPEATEVIYEGTLSSALDNWVPLIGASRQKTTFELLIDLDADGASLEGLRVIAKSSDGP